MSSLTRTTFPTSVSLVGSKNVAISEISLLITNLASSSLLISSVYGSVEIHLPITRWDGVNGPSDISELM